MMKLTDDGFRNKKTLSNEVLDAYHLISLNKDCSFALKISYRMLLETGLKPAISCIAKTIVGTALSNDHFGQYQLSALFVKGSMSFIDNVYCSDCLQRHLGERLTKFFLNHHQKPVMYFVNKETEHALGQYPTRENFTHISNLTLTISLRIQTNKSSFSYGYLDDQCDVYIDVPGTYFHDKHYLRAKHLFETEYTILSKGDELPRTGLKRTYILPECIGADISKLS
ncbi:hypothetical protein MAM1_0197d07788 [Mucor ambiguus]|uniref:Uncharacterized protein n=1 Tax=Mucor ambiguus TaxID=91626 RepID=A0A0C9MLA6_9FUNG|nr:hypothetical protein MAM1_0197d07788 [Mucor ambiguus]